MLKRALIVFVAVLTATWGAAAWSQVKELPWGTSAVGSAGHKALVVLAELLNREMPKYRITVQPTPGAIVTVKGYATGQFEGYYGADIAFYELRNDTRRFAGFKASMKRQPVQSFWTYTIDMGIAVQVRDKDKYKSWRDLTGKALFTGMPPWDTRAQLERAFDALGVKYQIPPGRPVRRRVAPPERRDRWLLHVQQRRIGGAALDHRGVARDRLGRRQSERRGNRGAQEGRLRHPRVEARGFQERRSHRQGGPAAVLLRLSRRS